MQRTGFAVLVLFLSVSSLFAKYKIREIKIKPAKEYAAHQDFQKIVIAAQPCDTEEKIVELFDTPKLYEKKIMPVLIVIENNNDFAIRLNEKEVFFIDVEGSRMPPISYVDVLLQISLKKPLTSYATKRDILIRSVGNKDMVMDFEKKSFGEKLIAPHSSDHGVVFFKLPDDGDLSGARLYFPAIDNLTEDEQLMFFEFELAKVEND